MEEIHQHHTASIQVEKKEHHIKWNLEIVNSGQLPRKLIAKIINLKTEYLDDFIS